MSLKFTNYDDYILIESSKGMDYWEIMEGIPELISMKDKSVAQGRVGN